MLIIQVSGKKKNFIIQRICKNHSQYAYFIQTSLFSGLNFAALTHWIIITILIITSQSIQTAHWGFSENTEEIPEVKIKSQKICTKVKILNIESSGS